jgi:Gram-positive signal peptide protein, YSIRK family
MNNLRKKEKFSIRKFSVGIASILIGSSMLMTYPQDEESI